MLAATFPLLSGAGQSKFEILKAVRGRQRALEDHRSNDARTVWLVESDHKRHVVNRLHSAIFYTWAVNTLGAPGSAMMNSRTEQHSCKGLAACLLDFVFGGLPKLSRRRIDCKYHYSLGREKENGNG
jgi:hypothetical protein